MKVKTTAIVADLRNKLNGTVFSKNRYGLYGRTKVTPVNPQTTSQQAQRAQFGNLSSGWRGLTQDQRNAWIAAAPTFPTTDVFGDTIILSGQALYISLNRNLLLAGQPGINLPPTPVAMPAVTMTGVSGAAGSPALSAAFDTATQPAGFTSVFKATPPIIASRLYVKNRLRNIGTAAITASAANLLTIWGNKFGSLIAGQRVTVEFFLVNNTTGQASTPSIATAIIAA